METKNELRNTGAAMRILLLLGFFITANSAFAQTAPRKHISPSAVEILTSIAENAVLVRTAIGTVYAGQPSSMIDPAVTASDLLNGNFRVKLEPKVDTLPRKVKISIFPASSAEGQPLLAAAPGGLTSPFFDFVNLAKEVMLLTYPATVVGLSVTDWRASLNLSALRDKIDERTGVTSSILSKCAVKVQSRERDYWFSVVPVNLECHAISSLNVHAGIDMLWMPQYDSAPTTTDQAPSTSVFENGKKNIALELIVAAVIQHAQVKIHTEDGTSGATRVWARNKARCFPAKGFSVRTTLASQAVPFIEKTPGSNFFEYDEVLHQMMPEPLYALAQHVEYYGSTVIGATGDVAKGNRYITFNNRVNGTTVTETPALTLKAMPVASAGGSVPLKFNPTGTMHFMFNIRDISHSAVCSGTSPVGPINVVPFCQMPKTTPEEKKFQFLPSMESLMSHDS